MTEEVLTPFFENFFTPKYLSTFRSTLSEVKILYFTSPTSSATEILLQVYPFMTLYDVKILLYQHFSKNISAHPSFQSLLLPLAQMKKRNNSEEIEFELDVTQIAKEYTTFEYTWITESLSNLLDPFTQAGGPSVDTQFVSETGRKNISAQLRSRMTIEDFLDKMKSDTLVLHLFLYKDILPKLQADLRTSEREWYGRIGPYFPELEINQSTTSLSSQLMMRAKVFDAYVTGVEQQMNSIDELLSEQSVALLPIVVAGCKFLRLVWKPSDELSTIPLETLFYKLDVTHERPFLRILPVGSTPTTKLKMDGAFKVPDVSDPRLLQIWKDERSPKPDKDFLFSKIIIRRTVGSQPALYGTLRVFDDNSADFIVLPPKQLRLLDPRSDLSAIGSLLQEGFKDIPLVKSVPDIGEATIICAIRLPLQAKYLTTDALRKRLGAFSCLFQEIPALPGDKPLLMLRYRAVSNYAAEDKVYTFLTLMSSRSMAKGDAAIPELATALQKEFQITEEEAQEKVIYWLRNRGKIQLAIPETKDYIMTYNTGIDIAIFGQQSYYTIHLYRLDSVKVFHRIITALSLLLSVKEKTLAVNQRDAQQFEQVINAVEIPTPRSEKAEQQTAAAAAVAANEETSAPGTNNVYLRLMMGNTGAEGEGEVFNLGNAVQGEGEGDVLNLGEPAVESEEAMNITGAGAGPRATTATTAMPQRKQVEVENAEDDEGEEVNTFGKKKKSYQGWVKSQLQAADQRLFQYSTEVAGRKIKKYVTMCQATESRQPYVFNREQYLVMRETYKRDEAEDGVVFQEYPLEPGEPLAEIGKEIYTVLKYGTNPLKQNYYMCCQFFCTKDYIMIREKDFYSSTDRQGRPKLGESSPGKKDTGSCPFCHKLEIKVMKSPGPNETVIQRRSKKTETKRHLYVSFLQGETQHPEEFYMPCCFTEDTPLYISDPRFDKVKGDEEKKDDEDVRPSIGVPATSYQVTLYRAHKKYIVGPEKEFLKINDIDGPQIGLLPTSLDKYFGQEPKEYVSREANKMELLPNANCFLRVGVENRSSQRFDSFFAALAPSLEFRNTAESVKARIREVISPRVFTFLNYGNLVLEFYDPGDPGPSENELRLWMSRELQVDLNTSNQDAAMRIWKSYHHFLGFLESTQTKEYRQFAQMLALPGLLAPRGLILVVMELNEKDELTVKCPPFGYNIEQYSSSDIGFILHRSSGIWEPIFYSSNRAQTARFTARHQPEITFQRSVEAGWPSIVKQRVAEFTNKCYSIGRGAYTSSRRIDPMSLVPLSRAIQAMPQIATGVVRDVYNHVVAITFRAKAGKPGLVALPVVDDEYVPVTRTIHLDWDDYTPAPMDFIVEFYKNNFEDIFASYPRYKIMRRIKSRGTGRYVALQLANGLYIPAGAPKVEEDVLSLPLGEVDEMEWSLNRAIYFGKDDPEPEEKIMKARESEMREIFEHLRLTFSNWLSSESASSQLARLKEVIESTKLPLFEKRKRLEILLGPMVLSWMDTETPKGEHEGSLLRTDCRLQVEEVSCQGKCVWRQETGGAGVGRCSLHSPVKFHLGGRLVNGPHLLMMRLFEELLRFPERRKQMFTGSVTTLVTLKDAVRIGEQYILPESSIAWQDILRLDWIEAGKEKKKYYEEMSRKEEEVEESAMVVSNLPDILKELFGTEDPKTRKLFVLTASVSESVSPLTPYLAPLGTSATEIGLDETTGSLTRDAVKRLVLVAKRPIIYINTIRDPPEVYSFDSLKHQKTSIPFILLYTEDGPQLLSSSSTFPQDVRPERMPKGLYDIYEKRVGITI